MATLTLTQLLNKGGQLIDCFEVSHHCTNARSLDVLQCNIPIEITKEISTAHLPWAQCTSQTACNDVFSKANTNKTEKRVHFSISKPRVSVQVMWFPGPITQGAELVSALQQRAQRHVQQQVQFSFLVWSPSGAGFFFGCHHNPHVGHSPIIPVFSFSYYWFFVVAVFFLFFVLLMADCSHQILMLTSLKAPHESTELISVYSILKKKW